jgi:hypothetical protein
MKRDQFNPGDGGRHNNPEDHNLKVYIILLQSSLLTNIVCPSILHVLVHFRTSSGVIPHV